MFRTLVVQHQLIPSPQLGLGEARLILLCWSNLKVANPNPMMGWMRKMTMLSKNSRLQLPHIQMEITDKITKISSIKHQGYLVGVMKALHSRHSLKSLHSIVSILFLHVMLRDDFVAIYVIRGISFFRACCAPISEIVVGLSGENHSLLPAPSSPTTPSLKTTHHWRDPISDPFMKFIEFLQNHPLIL